MDLVGSCEGTERGSIGELVDSIGGVLWDTEVDGETEGNEVGFNKGREPDVDDGTDGLRLVNTEGRCEGTGLISTVELVGATGYTVVGSVSVGTGDWFGNSVGNVLSDIGDDGYCDGDLMMPLLGSSVGSMLGIT